MEIEFLGSEQTISLFATSVSKEKVMISLLLGAALFQKQYDPTVDVPWVKLFLKSKRGQRALTSEVIAERTEAYNYKAPEMDRPKFVATSEGMHSEATPGSRVAMDMMNRASRRINALILQGNYEEAHVVSRAARKLHPEYWWLGGVYVEEDLLSGHYDDALNLGAVRVDDGGLSEEVDVLQLSIATSAKGLTFPGQARYCEDWIRKFSELQNITWTLPPTHHEMNARQVMVLSSIAMGVRGDLSGVPYLELALKLDPKNSFAAHNVIRLYEFRERYSDIRRVAALMVKNLPIGTERDDFERTAKRVANLKDGPRATVASF